MKTLLKLMDIKTLVAGIIPVIIGSVYSLYKYNSFSIIDMVVLMFGIILLQSCTNMINDLYDYKRGADSDDKSDEKALASGEISHKQVIKIIIVFIVIDVMIAAYYSIINHYGIFVVSLLGALIMYLYSAGKHPISYTPFGELVAGVTMGFGIMCTVIYIQSGILNIDTFLVVIPTAIYIGTILLTNNISDQHEDKINGRHTLPIILGVNKSQSLWMFNCYLLLVVTLILVTIEILPIESLILSTLFVPHKQIINFRNIEKKVQNKGVMMGLIGQVGLKFHLAILLGLLIAKFVRPILINLI